MNPELKKQDTQELMLEEILREFGSEETTPQPQEETIPEQIPDLTVDTIRMSPVSSLPSENTLSFDTIRMTPVVSATPSASLSSDTAVFIPIGEEAELPEEFDALPPTPKSESAEPYSDEWEPEYEEPMGEYTPKDPIPFPEKTRLRQLRKKLVAGPERRYHALEEAGVGQLQMGIIVSFILTVLSVGLTVVYTLGLIDTAWVRTVVFCQFLLAMLCALVGCYRLLDGLGGLLRGRFTMDATLFFTFLACIADGLLCLSAQRLSASSLFCLQIFMAQVAAYQRHTTEMRQMDVLRKASDLTAVVKVTEYWKERPGYVTTEGEPEAFLDHYTKLSGPEKALAIHAVLCLLASTALAVVVYTMQDLNAAVSVFMAAQLMSRPVSVFVSMSRPTAILQNRLHRLGSVLCGWKGIRATQRKCVYPLRHADLFPEGSVKMNGVKFYGTTDPGRVVSYTTALLTAEGSGLLPVFRLLPRSRSSMEHTVEEFAQQNGGIRGLVDGWTILVGTAECMAEQGVEIPADAKIPQALYTAVDGQLSCVFAITYSRSKFSAAGLRALCNDRKLTPTLIACDFLLTPQFIRKKLKTGVRRVKFPDREERLALSQITPPDDAPVIALTTKDGLAPKAYALTGARALKGAMRAGAVIHILGGTLGLAAVAALVLNGAADLLTPINLLLYTAVWSIPGLLITESPRYL